MPSDRQFRLANALSLMLACLCLGYSEWDLLPEVAWFTGVVICLILVSCLAGPRVELSNAQANRLGVVIGLAASVWVGWQIIRPTGGLVYTLPWPASLLPYLGPLLMVLIPAKLFRSKHIGDWWALQGIGLVAVGLAGAMAEDLSFGGLLGLYLLASVWSLSLFFYRRGVGGLPPIPDQPLPPQLTALTWIPFQPSRVFLRSSRWAILACLMALPLFFLTPRSPGSRWQFGNVILETGFASEQMIDLNHTGDLKANPEVAFEVVARYPDGTPNDRLPPNQRWRGVAFRSYQNGRWSQSGPGVLLFTTRGMSRWEVRDTPPDLGPESFTLEFHLKKQKFPVLADPVIWRAQQPSPIVTFPEEKPWYQLPDAGFMHPNPFERRDKSYRQQYASPREKDLSPPCELLPVNPLLFNRQSEPSMGEGAMRESLTTVRLKRLQSWALVQLDRLIHSGHLPEEVRRRATKNPRTLLLEIDPLDYELVARAFCDYFARSGEFRYDLRIRRKDKSIDPIEDFILNTKSGHCERFASALALTLRSLGVPCQFVLGFRGCEFQGEGRYLVRQENAHSWVEVLITRPAVGSFFADLPDPPKRVWHWLSLDPTPGGDDDERETASDDDWLSQARQRSTLFFENFVVGYDQERRQQIVSELGNWLSAVSPWLIVIPGGVAIVLILRRRWPRSRPGQPEPAWRTGVAWYDASLVVFAEFARPFQPGETFREYAAHVQQRLRELSAPQAICQAPQRLTEYFYHQEYAGSGLSPSAVTEIATALQELQQFLTTVRRGDGVVPASGLSNIGEKSDSQISGDRHHGN